MSYMVKSKLKITDLNAVRLAAQMMGMVCEERKTYRAHHNRSDAVLVLRCSEKQVQEIQEKHKMTPYELGIVPDGEGNYVLSYDSWCNGFGLHDVIGKPVTNKDGTTLAPTFMMHYNMACDVIDAKANGDEIEFQRMPDGSYQSVTKTEARVGI